MRNRHIAQNTEKEYVQCDLLSEKVGTRIISSNTATIKRLHKQKQQQTSTKSVLGICCFAIHISKKDLKTLVKYAKINIVYEKERHNYECYRKTAEESCKGICGVLER